MKKLKPYEGWLDIVQRNHIAIPIHCITEELPADDEDIKLLDYGLALWWISAVEVSEAFNKAFEPTHLSEFAQYVAMQYLEQLATDKETKKE